MSIFSNLTRAVVVVGVIGVVAVPVTLGAPAPVARTGVTPVPGKVTPCRDQPPKLLGSGRAPRALLRIDLKPVASVRRAQVYFDHLTTRLQVAKATQTSRLTRKVVTVFTTRAIDANGRVPFAGHNAVTFPGSKVPKAPHNTFVDDGYFNALNGGAYGTNHAGTGGFVITDRFPAPGARGGGDLAGRQLRLDLRDARGGDAHVHAALDRERRDLGDVSR